LPRTKLHSKPITHKSQFDSDNVDHSTLRINHDKTAESLPDLNARQLTAVLALAEHRSFIATAAALQISQPALTRTIKQVERMLDVPLFERTTRRVRVTAAGKEFVAIAGRVLNDLSIGIGALRKRDGHPAGQVLVSSVHSLSGALLGTSIASYGRQFPGIQIQLREGVQGDVLDDVASGVADFGVGYVDGLPNTLLGATLAIERFRVVLPSRSPLSARAQFNITELKDAQLVSFPPDSRTRRMVDGAAAAAGFALRYVVTVNRLPTLLDLVRNGVGLAIVPASEYALACTNGLISRQLVGPRLGCRLGVIRLRNRELSPPAAALFAIARRWVHETAALR
jgi:DNA-binding transcriptional LysR family regulator